ncbi:MAG: alkaline phosphatase [Hahellaceae bacterium]|nr:alkaline phosphatase [Hahellaceae bacterium]MCP5170140.1 alkaline phosphatase [Hahellaceae bacterium]
MKKSTLTRGLLTLAIAVATQSAVADLPEYQKSSSWFTDSQTLLQQKLQNSREQKAVKNVILFVGDGMGVSTLTAARILEGQQQGKTGEENFLSFEKFPFSGLVKTYNTNQQTPDSAGTMTAMMSGVKTKAGVINISEDTLRADCASSKGKEVSTLLEMAEYQGMATGVVTTARITHATPAATYAKTPERDWEYSAKGDCKDIATQMIEFPIGDGIDVAMGGGRRNFLPKEMKDVEGKSGKRTDGVNLVETWKSKHAQGVYIETQAQFDAIPAGTKQVLGLFNDSHMRYEADRANDTAGEPSLTEMTKKALSVLKQNDKGFFLMVEGGRIDHGHHAGSAYNALTDAIEFSKAVKAATENVNLDETLILVTADHSHVFTIAGYPTRGNPILGLVVSNDKTGSAQTSPVLADDNKPYTAVGYQNGLGYADLGTTTDADARYNSGALGGRAVDLSSVDTKSSGFHQEALVPLQDSETHAGEDVAIHATGASAYLVQGDMEQHQIFHIMSRALGLSKSE